LEFQNPKAVCRITSGVGDGIFTAVDVTNLSPVTRNE